VKESKMACSDPSLSYLNKLGYNVVRLPRKGIEPLDVLGRDESLEKIGTLADIVDSPAPLPGPLGPNQVADLKGQTTADLDVAIGLRMLANALSGMAAAVGLPTLKASFKSARSVQFAFTDVQAFTVNPTKIGEYLAAGRLRENPVLDRYFSTEDTDEYVIFEVLKADSLVVIPKSDTGVGLAVDIPVLQGVVGASIDVKAGTTSASAIVFKGPELITFGFKCFQLAHIDGRWRIAGTKASPGLAFIAAEAAADAVVIGLGRLDLR
jgi:hypothetical protein